MRCPHCAERNSVAARKCEFCGSNFKKKKPLPIGLKLGIGGIAIAITASIAASYVVPHFVDPEQNLGRVAKRLASGPTSVEQAGTIKKEFAEAVKAYLKTSGGNKVADLTKSLQKVLPDSAFEVHIVELPRGLRVVEIDTVLQATDFLVMKTNSGLKVFDLPGFEVFDDARILNDTAGPVLALLGHTGGQLPHRPILRCYALMPDYIHDESEKLVPPLKIDGTAKFAKNNQDVHFELNLPSKSRQKKSTERLAYGTLKWKDAKYSSDFGASAALIAAKQVKEAVKTANARMTSQAMPVTAPLVVAQTPAPVAAPQVIPVPVVVNPAEKIVVRSFTGADAARTRLQNATNAQAAAARETAQVGRSNDSVLAAVPAISGLKDTYRSIKESVESSKRSEPSASIRSKQSSQTRSGQTTAQRVETAKRPAETGGSTSRSAGEVIAAGATLRANPTRGAAAMNSFGKGTEVAVLGKDQDWYKVRVNGQEGYIHSSLLQVGSTPEVVAAAPAPASGQSSRRRRRQRTEERTLIAEASPRKQPRSRREHQVATEPILVP